MVFHRVCELSLKLPRQFFGATFSACAKSTDQYFGQVPSGGGLSTQFFSDFSCIGLATLTGAHFSKFWKKLDNKSVGKNSQSIPRWIGNRSLVFPGVPPAWSAARLSSENVESAALAKLTISTSESEHVIWSFEVNLSFSVSIFSKQEK